MKCSRTILLSATLLTSIASAQNITQSNMQKAQQVIDAAVLAHGGSERLSGLKSLVVDHQDTNFAVGQSRSAEPPVDRDSSAGRTAIDLEMRVFASRVSGIGGGYEFDNTTVINSEQSLQVDHRAKTRAKIENPDFDTTSGPFVRVTPALLVRQMRDRSANAYYLGESKVGEENFEVVAFSMAVGPGISLYFDKENHLLRRSERVLPGFGLIEYRFEDYETIDGLAMNRKFGLYVNGEENIQRVNQRTQLNVAFDDLINSGTELAEIPPIIPDELRLQEIGDKVYLVGGAGTYAMFVDMGDHFVAVGGTAGIPERIAILRREIGDKPIKFGVLTHHHSDHVLGVAAYEQEGATVVGSVAHEAVVRGVANNGDALQFEGVKASKTFKAGGRRLEVIDIGPTPHSEHLLVTWLPTEGILFEADHFAMPLAGPVGPANVPTKAFAEALKRLKLHPKLIASAHSPRPGTMSDLAEALAKEAARVNQQAP